MRMEGTAVKKDLVIVGGGPAGYHCALQCARLGLKPLLIEKDALGGTGLRWGCLPVKTLMDGIRRVKSGFEREPEGSLSAKPLARETGESLLADCRSKMAENSRRMEHTLTEAGVEVMYGNLRLISDHALELNEKTIEFNRLVLATGTEALPPQGVVPDGRHIITHREAVNLTTPPKSVVILGGDVEGLEFASLFSELGTKVTVLEMQPDMLAGFDDDLTAPLFHRLALNGVTLERSARVEAVHLTDTGVEVVTTRGNRYQAEKAMVAMARRPVVPEGLENTSLVLEQGRIPVNDQCATKLPHVYCIGDLNGRMEMAHTALQQGIFLADHLAAGQDMGWDYGTLPWVIFGLPQCGGAGAQEKNLKEQGIPYRKSVVYWKDTWRGIGQGEAQGFLKVLVSDEGNLLGIWLTGENISEMAALAGVVVNKKTTLQQVKQQLWVHPTLSEALLQAVLQLT